MDHVDMLLCGLHSPFGACMQSCGSVEVSNMLCLTLICVLTIGPLLTLQPLMGLLPQLAQLMILVCMAIGIPRHRIVREGRQIFCSERLFP